MSNPGTYDKLPIIMLMLTVILLGATEFAGRSIGSAFGRARIIALRLATCIAEAFAAAVERYSAAVLYEVLSRLSDEELERRGIARGDLHRHVLSTTIK